MAETRTQIQVRLVLETQCRFLADLVAANLPREQGFALFLFDFGDGGNCAYVSNAQRETMIAAVRQWLARQEQS